MDQQNPEFQQLVQQAMTRRGGGQTPQPQEQSQVPQGQPPQPPVATAAPAPMGQPPMTADMLNPEAELIEKALIDRLKSLTERGI